MSLVTDALFAELNRRGCEGIWPNSGRRSGAKCALVTAGSNFIFQGGINSRNLPDRCWSLKKVKQFFALKTLGETDANVQKQPGCPA